MRPDEFYSNALLNPPVSTINVPIEFDVKNLEKLFNKEFSGVIYNDTSFADHDQDNLKLKAYKMENITFSIENGLLSYRVPLLVEIAKKIDVSAFGFTVSDVKEATASLALKFKTKLSVNKDWTISSHTTSGGYEWLSTPSLKLGPVSLPLPLVSDVLLESNLGSVNREIDAAIKESFDLKSLSAQTWLDIQRPLQVSADPPLWILITPKEAYAVPLQASGQAFRESVGVTVTAELFYGEAPVRNPVPGPPPLKITSRIDEGFTVSLMTGIPFSEINTIAKKQLTGYTVKQGKYILKIEDVELFGNGDKLVVAANVSGSVKGTIYLTGTPWYDKLTSTLRIRELDFDIRTKNALVKSASWVLRGGITGKLSESLSFPAGGMLDQARAGLHRWLSVKHSYGYFTVTGSLDRLELDKIVISSGSVKALFTFSGVLNLGLAEE